MPTVPVPNVMQANVRFTLDAQHIENVFNFMYPTDDFEGAADSVYSTLNDVWWAQLRPWLSDAVFSDETYIVDLSDVTGAVVTKQPFSPARGASSEYAVPNGSAYCVTHRTARRGRSYRGRSYISGLAVTQVQGSYVLQTAVDGLVGAFNAMRVALEADDIFFCVVSLVQDKVPLDFGVSTPVSLSIGRDRVIDSQRRRLPGRGA